GLHVGHLEEQAGLAAVLFLAREKTVKVSGVELAVPVCQHEIRVGLAFLGGGGHDSMLVGGRKVVNTEDAGRSCWAAVPPDPSFGSRPRRRGYSGWSRGRRASGCGQRQTT